MLFSLLDNPVLLILAIPTVLIALSAHECAHGLVAWKLGDPTAHDAGRLTLNPLHHLNPVGAACLLLLGFGWATPVPVNPRYFKKPRSGMALVAVAGPLTNLLLSVMGGFLYVLTSYVYSRALDATGNSTALSVRLIFYLGLFFYVFHIMNLSLCLFNLLPLPPLDGYRVLSILLPAKASFWLYRHERQISLAMTAWLLLGSFVYPRLIALPSISASPWLSRILKVLSLTGWLSDAVSFLSDGILLPFFRLFSL